MLLQSVFWCCLSIRSTVLLQDVPALVTILMALNAICFAGFAFLFDRSRWLNVLAAPFLLGNLILTITDQMGIYDWIVLILNLTTMVFWIYLYKRRGKAAQK